MPSWMAPFHSLGWDDWYEVYFWSCHAMHHMKLMELSMVHDTDVSTSTSTGTKVIIPLTIIWPREMPWCQWWHNQHHVTLKILLPCTCQKLICPSNATNNAHVPITSCAQDNPLSIYASNDSNAINNVTMNTDIHTFHIIGICPWANMPVTFYIHVPLHYYCGLHIDPSLL